MYKFLLTTDGSENSLQAARHLLSVINNYHDPKIYTIAVYNMRMVVNTEATLPAIEYNRFTEIAKKFARDALSKTVAIFQEAGIEAKDIIKEGEPGQVIADTAFSLGIDQIVMGASGMGKVKELFMGSVNRKVISLSPIPVTIAK